VSSIYIRLVNKSHKNYGFIIEFYNPVEIRKELIQKQDIGKPMQVIYSTGLSLPYFHVLTWFNFVYNGGVT